MSAPLPSLSLFALPRKIEEAGVSVLVLQEPDSRGAITGALFWFLQEDLLLLLLLLLILLILLRLPLRLRCLYLTLLLLLLTLLPLLLLLLQEMLVGLGKGKRLALGLLLRLVYSLFGFPIVFKLSVPACSWAEMGEMTVSIMFRESLTELSVIQQQK